MKRGKAFCYEVPVTFRDLDVFGHVNNAVYLTYLESARSVYYLDLIGGTAVDQIDFIVARVEVNFRSAAGYGETVQVWLRPVRVGETSFELEYLLLDKRSSRTIADATSIQVLIDHFTHRKKRVSPTLRRSLENEALRTFPER